MCRYTQWRQIDDDIELLMTPTGTSLPLHCAPATKKEIIQTPAEEEVRWWHQCLSGLTVIRVEKRRSEMR